MYLGSFIQSSIDECELSLYVFYTHRQKHTLNAPRVRTRQAVTPRSRSPNTDKRRSLLSFPDAWEGEEGGQKWRVGKKKTRGGEEEEWNGERRGTSNTAMISPIQMLCLDRQMTFSESHYLQSGNSLHPVENLRSVKNSMLVLCECQLYLQGYCKYKGC